LYQEVVTPLKIRLSTSAARRNKAVQQATAVIPEPGSVSRRAQARIRGLMVQYPTRVST